jgi:hypothetical protein
MDIKRNSTIVLWICATGAGVSTLFGLAAMMSGGVQGIVIPVVMAITVCFGLGQLWHFMLHIVPALASSGRRLVGLALAAVLTLIAVSVSSWFVTTAIGGRNAVRIDMAEKVEGYRHALDTAVANVLAEQQLVPDIERLAGDMNGLADSELTQGRLSGRPGKGPVVDTLKRAAATYKAAADEAQAARDWLAGLQRAATRHLKALDEIVAGTEHTAEAQRRFASASGDFRQKVAEIQSISIMPAVRRLGMPMVPATATGAGQADAISAVRDAFVEHSAQLTRKADAIAAQRVEPVLIANRPINPGEAVIEHGDQVLPAWAVGVGIDLLPLLLLSILVVAALEGAAVQREARAPERAPADPRRPHVVTPAE